ncbi:unnamed protein product [Haemonchus placei]|uniref:Integral membrane protein n=1 Tax=Haemonchus placei TaxID=6290 RepID=A0A0N4W2T3_HAEPC|nr:unnamed protein product [Haemonchus placei]
MRTVLVVLLAYAVVQVRKIFSREIHVITSVQFYAYYVFFVGGGGSIGGNGALSPMHGPRIETWIDIRSDQ